MIENKQKTEKKKRGLCRRIFRYIGLGLLILLLIASVFYHAPWKVITLLAVVLAGSISIPESHRKWFWFFVAFVVIALIIWVFLPEDNEGWRPYKFDKELAELEAKYSIPEEQNAALIYDDVFNNLDIDVNQPEFFIKSKPSSKDGPWLSKDHPQSAEWLKGHRDTIDKLLQAAKKDKCIFLPIKADHMNFGEYINHLPEIRQCAWLLISAANNDLAEGRFNTGIEKYLSVFRMAEHMYQQPAMLFHIVGFGIERYTLEPLNQFVIEYQPSLELLLIVSNLIDVENNWNDYWLRTLEYEKLFAKNMTCYIAYETNSKGKVRLNRDIITSDNDLLIKKLPPSTYFRRKLFKAKTILNWFNYPSSPQKVAEIIDDSFNKYYSMIEPDYDWTTEPKKWDPSFMHNYISHTHFNFKSFIQNSINMSEDLYYKHHGWYLKNLALHRSSRLLIAIKIYHTQHGTWPDSLDAIKSGVPAEAFIDPVSKNEFEYENHGERFSLFGETINIWPK